MSKEKVIQAFMHVNATCPECGKGMLDYWSYLMCGNSKCKLYEKKFEVPTIELKEKIE